MSSPEIALHKKDKMKEKTKREYVRRSQRDYSMPFKLAVVLEIERGETSIFSTQRKYGIQGNATVINGIMEKNDW